MKRRIFNRFMIPINSNLKLLFLTGLSIVSVTVLGLTGCSKPEIDGSAATQASSPLDRYVATPDTSFHYEHVHTIEGDGYKAHVIRMNSQRWLTTTEVKDPLWWHWLTMIVPDSVQSRTGLLYIGGGSRKDSMPKEANPDFIRIALTTNSVVTALHNVPNQPIEFVGDDFGPRVEDELIAYAWRQYLEAGAKESDSRWLPRLPMTNAAVRAMDVITAISSEKAGKKIDSFVVAGGSKRGWTTWTTAIADRRVVAIIPIVIDMLNVVPSFQHHWRAYGFWAPAVGDYVHEGIMEWQQSTEYQRLMKVVEPYSFRNRLSLPKLLINASGDQFFLPDSCRFYWDDLLGEKHVRYVPNADHSLSGSDAIETIAAFHHAIINNRARPDFEWRGNGGKLNIITEPGQSPQALTLWQATNPNARDFRLETIGKSWKAQPIVLADDGHYQITVEAPKTGWTAFFVELTFPGTGEVPLKLTTGIVVVPDTVPHAPYKSSAPKGTPIVISAQ